ncbi:MAG: hypothetical protein JOZ45_11135 [Acidobacteriaceae bacterium]|nr:hypothetical protein [Acidobacteriaceae bacterium]
MISCSDDISEVDNGQRHRDKRRISTGLPNPPSTSSCPSGWSRNNKWLERLDLSRVASSTVEILSKGMTQQVQFIAAGSPLPNMEPSQFHPEDLADRSEAGSGFHAN